MTPQATGGDKFAHLANYLAAAGFTAEAKLARRAADSIEDRQKLEQTLHKIKPQLPLSPRLIEM